VTVAQRSSSGRDERAVARFVERYALQLAEAGMPRMAARVFIQLLATDEGKATAAELAAGLHVSPAAISGAVRYLDQVGLIAKARDPGERRDHYEVADDLWYEVYGNRDKQMQSWISVLDDGVAAVGKDTPAGRRLDQTRRFVEFLTTELAALMERWHHQEDH
jgi:DNA-binding transcriptional regulator GbsR (MarR family)